MAKHTAGFKTYNPFPVEDPQTAAHEFFTRMNRRRSVRDFSDKLVPKAVIQNLIMTASSAPSGAHKQPWTFVAVSDPVVKKKIRVAAEKEEYEFYHGRATDDWLEDLKPT